MYIYTHTRRHKRSTSPAAPDFITNRAYHSGTSFPVAFPACIGAGRWWRRGRGCRGGGRGFCGTVVSRWNGRLSTGTHCNTLQRTATLYHALQHSATHTTGQHATAQWDSREIRENMYDSAKTTEWICAKNPEIPRVCTSVDYTLLSERPS